MKKWIIITVIAVVIAVVVAIVFAAKDKITSDSLLELLDDE